MPLQNTPYSTRSGIKIFKFASNNWRHIDTNDAAENLQELPYKRQVGPTYRSKKELLSDHVPYLLRAGWLKLEIDLPIPEFVTSSESSNTMAYAWAMEDKILDLRVYGTSKAKAVEAFKFAVSEVYGNAVTINELGVSKSNQVQLFSQPNTH